jgi:glycosyltransferase involved in cell wall biosynthesis
MTLPSVGVVIPTRDRPELLTRAIGGVLAQDYAGPLRIIVVYDQGSPDYLLARGGDRPLLVMVNWRTPGLAGARNTGILSLDTELVAFCDDDDVWAPSKITRQVQALGDGEFATCAMEVEYGDQVNVRRAGNTRVGVDDLARSRMAMLHASSFLIRRSSLVDAGGPDPGGPDPGGPDPGGLDPGGLDPGGLGLVAEDAPGSQNEDWDLLLRAARRAPIRHVDEPLVRVAWSRASYFTYEYATKVASLRWMIARHPEISRSGVGAARVYGQLACWSAASGDRASAMHWARRAVRCNWREPRAAIALVALSGVVRVEDVLGALHKRGRGI